MCEIATSYNKFVLTIRKGARCIILDVNIYEDTKQYGGQQNVQLEWYQCTDGDPTASDK